MYHDIHTKFHENRYRFSKFMGGIRIETRSRTARWSHKPNFICQNKKSRMKIKFYITEHYIICINWNNFFKDLRPNSEISCISNIPQTMNNIQHNIGIMIQILSQMFRKSQIVRKQDVTRRMKSASVYISLASCHTIRAIAIFSSLFWRGYSNISVKWVECILLWW
jgi:hypothetical protein